MTLPITLVEKGNQLKLSIGERQLSLISGDVLNLKADALICPVDQNLDFDSGFAKIVGQSAGRALHKERPLTPEPFGKVVVLPGGKLSVRYIFLTVLYGEKGLDKIKTSIRQAVERAIRYAEFMRLKSLAFPVLGDPRVCPPYDFVAHEMLENALLYFQRRNTKIKAIFFSAFNTPAFEALRKEARQIAD